MVTATVKLDTVIQKTDPAYLGVVSSTYGASPVSDTTLAKWERQLDARWVRIPIRWNGSKVVSSAQGSGVSNIKELVDLYHSWGYRLLLVVGGRTSDWDGYQNGDATQIIHTLGTQGIDYQSPNEPNNSGHSIAEVISRAKQIQSELDAAVPGTKLWGPVWASYDRNAIKQYAAAMSKAGFGGSSYHHYAMGSQSLSTSQAMSDTVGFGKEITDSRADLRGLGLPENVVIDEMNFSWRYQDGTPGGNNRFFTAVNTVWQASVFGHVLSSGGRGHAFATQNGPLGILSESGAPNPDNRPDHTPMPAYWGLAAWTGAGLFPHFKDAFYATTSDDPQVEIYAVNNEKGGTNLVCINKSEDTDKAVSINVGTKGTYDRFQTDHTKPYDAPVKADSAKAFDGSLSFTLPRMSVATLVLSASGSTGTTAPPTGTTTTPTPAPTTPTPAPTDPTVLTATSVHASGGSVAANPGTVTGVPAGLDASAFDSERYGDQTWTIPISGDKALDLFFAEKYAGVTAAGQRTFSVIVNGVVVYAALDVFSTAGNVRNKVVTKTVHLTGVTTATVTLRTVKGAPFINAIRIR